MEPAPIIRTVGEAAPGKNTKVILGTVGLGLKSWFVETSDLSGEQVTNVRLLARGLRDTDAVVTTRARAVNCAPHSIWRSQRDGARSGSTSSGFVCIIGIWFWLGRES